jgi:hypothetical protein
VVMTSSTGGCDGGVPQTTVGRKNEAANIAKRRITMLQWDTEHAP